MAALESHFGSGACLPLQRRDIVCGEPKDMKVIANAEIRLGVQLIAHEFWLQERASSARPPVYPFSAVLAGGETAWRRCERLVAGSAPLEAEQSPPTMALIFSITDPMSAIYGGGYPATSGSLPAVRLMPRALRRTSP